MPSPLVPPSTAPSPATPRPANPWALFVAFSRLSVMGFGGVLPIAHRELVERLRWLTPEVFTELLSVGQVLPGPNVVNLSLMVGDRYFGLRGALAALAGMLLAPTASVLTLAARYQGGVRWRGSRWATVECGYMYDARSPQLGPPRHGLVTQLLLER